VSGEWIPFYSNTGEGSSKLLPGDTYKEIWQVKLEGRYRYVREIFAEGYLNSIQFVFEWG
jgi:hypothetical protein